MRVGILTQYYPPEMGAAQARLSELAARLRARGHDVVVLTAMPSYPQAKVFAGYGGFSRREERQGIPVLRSWIWPSRSVRVAPRLASYLSFVLSSLLVGTTRLPRLDVLVTESPPLPLALSGYLLSRLKGARWVLNISDLWPESAVVLGVLGEGPATRAAYRFEGWCYRKAWRISGQTREICESIARRHPVVPVPLPGGVDTTLFRPEERSEELRARIFGDAAGTIAVYAGLHGIAQGLGQLLDAAARLRDDDVSIVLVGDGPEKPALEARAHAERLRNVRFVEPQPRELMPALLASADVALVPLVGGIEAVPSKLYEAMASGVPTVLAATGEAAEILEAASGGIAVAPQDADALADALRRLAADPAERRRLGASARGAAVERFDRRALCDRFIDILERGARA